jgi:hypothetical protein
MGHGRVGIYTCVDCNEIAASVRCAEFLTSQETRSFWRTIFMGSCNCINLKEDFQYILEKEIFEDQRTEVMIKLLPDSNGSTTMLCTLSSLWFCTFANRRDSSSIIYGFTNHVSLHFSIFFTMYSQHKTLFSLFCIHSTTHTSYSQRNSCVAEVYSTHYDRVGFKALTCGPQALKPLHTAQQCNSISHKPQTEMYLLIWRL